MVAVGTPFVGNEVIYAEKTGKTAGTSDVLKLRDMEFIHEILPVGSEGIFHEIKVLAEGSMLKFRFTKQLGVDVKKSAGPATMLLASLPESKLAELKHVVNKPVNVVGQLF